MSRRLYNTFKLDNLLLSKSYRYCYIHGLYFNKYPRCLKRFILSSMLLVIPELVWDYKSMNSLQKLPHGVLIIIEH